MSFFIKSFLNLWSKTDLEGRVIYKDMIKINGIISSYSFNCAGMAKGYYIIK